MNDRHDAFARELAREADVHAAFVAREAAAFLASEAKAVRLAASLARTDPTVLARVAEEHAADGDHFGCQFDGDDDAADWGFGQDD